MEDIYLDLSDTREMINFISHWLAFTEGDFKKHAESFIADYDSGKAIEVNELQNFTREFARQIFPARFALDTFFNNEGSGIEWSRVNKAVRRSTAHLMQRFKDTGEAHTINEMYKDDDFDMTFNDDERSEIEQVRHELSEDYWVQNKGQLTKYADKGEAELSNFEEAVSRLRECAAGLPTLLQEELYSKIIRFEDRTYYKGDLVDSSVLQEELLYYRDQKEIPIE